MACINKSMLVNSKFTFSFTKQATWCINVKNQTLMSSLCSWYRVQWRRSAEGSLVFKQPFTTVLWHTSPRVPDPHSHWINYVSSLTILILTSRRTYIRTLVLPQPRLGSAFTPLLSIWTCRMFTLLLMTQAVSLNPPSLLIPSKLCLKWSRSGYINTIPLKTKSHVVRV